MTYDPTEFPLVLEDHIPPRIRASIDILHEGGCWVWLGRISRNGYGRVKVDGVELAAHRFVYQAMIASVGMKTQLDHVCMNRRCVNPNHLEPVTPRENYRRRDNRNREIAKREKR